MTVAMAIVMAAIADPRGTIRIIGALGSVGVWFASTGRADLAIDGAVQVVRAGRPALVVAADLAGFAMGVGGALHAFLKGAADIAAGAMSVVGALHALLGGAADPIPVAIAVLLAFHALVVRGTDLSAIAIAVVLAFDAIILVGAHAAGAMPVVDAFSADPGLYIAIFVGAIAVADALHADLTARLADLAAVAIVIALTAHTHQLCQVAFLRGRAILVLQTPHAGTVVADPIVAVVVVDTSHAFVELLITDLPGGAMVALQAPHAGILLGVAHRQELVCAVVMGRALHALIDVGIADPGPFTIIIDPTIAADVAPLEIADLIWAIAIGSAFAADPRGAVADPLGTVGVLETAGHAFLKLGVT